MSNRMMGRLFAVLAASAVLTSALAGCGAKTENGQNAAEPAAPAEVSAAPTETSAAPAEPEAASEAHAAAPEKENAEEKQAEGRVRSVEELLEAIAPSASIVLEPGRYNITEFLANFPNPQDFDAWNESHKYVQISEVFDGLEIVVRDVRDLRIEGGSDDPAATELVIEPRHATVLGFRNCAGIELVCLTMGHTDGGDCAGNVLNLINCQNVRLRTMDLYGCGATGLSLMNGSGDVQVSNSTIRDCAYGPFEFYGGKGELRFTACILAGSDGGGYYTPENGTALSFYGCSFGEKESNRWFYDERAKFENCVWSEITQYPDMLPDVDPGMADEAIG